MLTTPTAALTFQLAAIAIFLGAALVLVGIAPAPAPVRPYRSATPAEREQLRLDRLADTLTAQQRTQTPTARSEAGPAPVDVAGPAHTRPARRDSASVISGPAVATTGGPVTTSQARAAAAGARGIHATPLTVEQRAERYQRQTGRPEATPAQVRRAGKKFRLHGA